MRLFLGIILVLFCLFIAYCLTGKYHFRCNFFGSFSSFHMRLLEEISFKQTSILNIIKNQDKTCDFNLLLSDFILDGKTEISFNYLTDEEKNFTKEYLEKVGRFDKETQLEYLGSVSNFIKEKQHSCINDEKKYKSLYIKLGFLIGLILLIVVL